MATRFIGDSNASNRAKGATDGNAVPAGYLGETVQSFGTAGVTQTGTIGANVIFNTSGAPTITLTAGTWLITGGTAGVTTNTMDGVAVRFYDNTAATSFGGGAPVDTPNTTANVGLTAIGSLTFTGASRTIYLYGIRNGSSILKIGYSGGGIPYCGYLMAIRIA